MMTRISTFLIFMALSGSSGLSQTVAPSRPPAKPPAISQTGATMHLEVSAPRPLIAALNALTNKYGWSVNYEDPPFSSKLDLSEVDPRYLVAHTGTAPHVPNGGAFSVDFPAGDGPGSSPDQEKTLRTVVDSYNQSKNPGRFELRRSSHETFDVVGTSAHDSTGQMAPQKVLLDFPLTLLAKPRSASDTVNLICTTLSENVHVKVTVGVLPRNVMKSKMVKVGGKKLPARELLASTIAATGRPLYWRLLYDSDSNSYVLNLHMLH